MDIQKALAKSLREVRKRQGFSQEDFPEVATRAYVSLIERGLRNPTISKLDQMSSAMGIHPLTLLTMVYLEREPTDNVEKLINKVTKEIEEIQSLEE